MKKLIWTLEKERKIKISREGLSGNFHFKKNIPITVSDKEFNLMSRDIEAHIKHGRITVEDIDYKKKSITEMGPQEIEKQIDKIIESESKKKKNK